MSLMYQQNMIVQNLHNILQYILFLGLKTEAFLSFILLAAISHILKIESVN